MRMHHHCCLVTRYSLLAFPFCAPPAAWLYKYMSGELKEFASIVFCAREFFPSHNLSSIISCAFRLWSKTAARKRKKFVDRNQFSVQVNDSAVTRRIKCKFIGGSFNRTTQPDFTRRNSWKLHLLVHLKQYAVLMNYPTEWKTWRTFIITFCHLQFKVEALVVFSSAGMSKEWTKSLVPCKIEREAPLARVYLKNNTEKFQTNDASILCQKLLQKCWQAFQTHPLKVKPVNCIRRLQFALASPQARLEEKSKFNGKFFLL